MITTSPTITTISAALLKFQGAVDGVGKNSVNPGFKSKYANLENVVDTARPALQVVGIVFLQSGGAIVEGVMAMSTRLIHAESGEWIEGTMDIALGKRDPQGVGSAQTYAQRYHLMAMLGLPPVDDDGEAAIDRNNSRPIQEAPKPAESPAIGTLAIDKMQGMKNTPQRNLWGRISRANRAVKTWKEFNDLWGHESTRAAIDGFTADWMTYLDDERRDKAAELSERLGDPLPEDRPFPGDLPPETVKAAKLANTP